MRQSSFMSIAIRGLRACGILAFTAALVAPLPAQTFYGSIVGTVTDPTGAPIPSAPVILTNTGTAERRARDTDNDGNYQFVNLVPGRYRVDIEKAGFKHLTRDEVVVEVQAAVRIDVAMQVGDVSQTVEVQAQTPLLQTETSAPGGVVEARKVQEMPLNGRNVLNLVALVPGVVPGRNTNHPSYRPDWTAVPLGVFQPFQPGSVRVARNRAGQRAVWRGQLPVK